MEAIDELVAGKTPEKLLDLARIAEASERYPDMCAFMKTLVEVKCKTDLQLEVEERNLLSVAYKNVVGSKRSSWRTLASGNFQDVKPDVVGNYKLEVEKELKATCQEVLNLLQKHLIPVMDKVAADDSATKSGDTKKNEELKETEVFYLKMCGDYYRYLSEFDDKQSHKDQTAVYYQKAMDVAKEKLPETHPTRLGLALNFSVCYYEILKQPDKACALAKEAFDAAIEKLDTLNDASYKDSTLIMQLLRDNLTLWTSEAPADADAAGQQDP